MTPRISDIPSPLVIASLGEIVNTGFSVCSGGYTSMAEIGVFNGATGFAMIDRCPQIREYWMVDHWYIVDGKRIGKNAKKQNAPNSKYEGMYLNVCRRSVFHPTARILRLPSVVAASLFPDDRLDVVYIDACHRYKDVVEDILAWTPKIRDGGTLCGHDYSFREPKKGPAVREAVALCIPEFDEKIGVKCGNVWFHELDGERKLSIRRNAERALARPRREKP